MPVLWWSKQCGYTGYSGYSGYTGYRGDYNGITIGLHFQLSPGLMWQSGAGYILVCRAVFRSDMLTCTTGWLRMLYDTLYDNCQLFHTFTPMGGFVTKDPKDYQFLRSVRISIPISACCGNSFLKCNSFLADAFYKERAEVFVQPRQTSLNIWCMSVLLLTTRGARPAHSARPRCCQLIKHPRIHLAYQRWEDNEIILGFLWPRIDLCD